MKKAVFFLFALLLSEGLFSQVSFSGLDLSSRGKVLFTAEAESPVWGNYRTLFETDIASGEIRQLTFFPEEISLLNYGKQIQITNRFGVFRTDTGKQELKAVKGFPSFVNGSGVQIGKVLPVQSSPDGKYLLYVKQTSWAFGDLMLFEASTQKETIIAPAVEISYNTLPISWSPESDYFVYQKKANVYYFSIEQYQKNRVISEVYRMVGPGLANCIQWGNPGEFYYIKGDLIFRIINDELFTRTLYTELLPIGEIAGKIPFAFDPVFDDFWIDPDGKRVLISKDGINVFLYNLGQDDFSDVTQGTSLPYLRLSRSARVKKVFWSDSQLVSIFVGSIESGKTINAVYRVNMKDKTPLFSRIEEENLKDMDVSRDYKYVVLLIEGKAVVKNYETWATSKTINLTSPLKVVFTPDNDLLIAGKESTILVTLKDSTTKTLCFSVPGVYGYKSDEKTIQMNKASSVYTFSDLKSEWEKAAKYEAREAATASLQYRVYVEPSPNGRYINTVMVRHLEGYETTSLFLLPADKYEAFPKVDEVVDQVNFAHGSRIRRREVSLVFDLMESVEGLTETLIFLEDYGLKGTFFLNGEFIRRYPDAAKEIQRAGHEVASMFYVNFNMTDSRYQIDEDFIKRGLARNEDEYYKATGYELSLFWHAPFYSVTSEIIASSAKMNYRYIGRDVEPFDWVGVEESKRLLGSYFSAHDIVERIMKEKKPGSIIPIRLGKSENGRSDYLFQHLDVLFNALKSEGYEIVTVSTIVDHNR